MGKTYYLDLNTLLSVLDNGLYTLSTSFMLSGTPAIGYLTLSKGTITSYAIQSPDGKQIYSDRALQVLQAQTQWQVQFISTPTSPEQPSSTYTPQPDVSSSLSPSPGALKQKRIFDSSLLEGLTAKQRLVLRTVLTMINGRRNADQIKAQLALPPEVVDEALERLRFLDIIE